MVYCSVPFVFVFEPHMMTAVFLRSDLPISLTPMPKSIFNMHCDLHAPHFPNPPGSRQLSAKPDYWLCPLVLLALLPCRLWLPPTASSIFSWVPGHSAMLGDGWLCPLPLTLALRILVTSHHKSFLRCPQAPSPTLWVYLTGACGGTFQTDTKPTSPLYTGVLHCSLSVSSRLPDLSIYANREFTFLAMLWILTSSFF